MQSAYIQNHVLPPTQSRTNLPADVVRALELHKIVIYYATYINWMFIILTGDKKLAPVGRWHHLAAIPVRGLYLLYLLAHGACLPMWLVVCVYNQPLLEVFVGVVVVVLVLSIRQLFGKYPR